MAERRRRPQEGGTPEQVIPPLGWLFLVCAIALYLMAFQLPWFGRFCVWCGNFSLILALGCLIYWLFLNKNEFIFWNEHIIGGMDLDIVNSKEMKEFLYQAQVVVRDPYDLRYEQIPSAYQTKNGLKIEAIGNLRQWLLGDKFRDDLESFLNRHGYDISVQSAHYKQDGWVYYSLIKGIKSDRLRF